jgi:hypothetical protein
MIKKEENRAKHLSIEKQYIKGVSLIDVDTAIADYMRLHIIPDLVQDNENIKVPLVYGNAERWNSARKEGYLRDTRGQLQIPIVMFKRNTVSKNDSLPFFNEAVTLPTIKKWSSKHRYDQFSLMDSNTRRVYEVYNVRVPEYVIITYEVLIWTNFTEHMNKIVEAYQWSDKRYWGNVDTYKFKTEVSSFDTQQEVGEGSERIIRTSFTLDVSAYLLPETFASAPLTQKSFSVKKIKFGVETDLTGNLLSNPKLYNEYSDVIDFVAIRGSQMSEFVNGTTVKLTNVILPILPPELVGSFDTVNWFSIYVNGQFINPSIYEYEYNANTNEIIFTFDTTKIFDAGAQLDINDEVAITGKFIQL